MDNLGLILNIDTNTANLSIAGSSTVLAQILDNDFYLGISTTTSTVTEGALVNFLLQCGNGQSGSISNVTVTFSGTYTPLPNPVSSSFNCANGWTIPVQTVNDILVNGNRTLIATITQQSGGYQAVNNAPVSVQDNDVVILPMVVPTLSLQALLSLMILLCLGGFIYQRGKQ